jgi:hypothetical protein
MAMASPPLSHRKTRELAEALALGFSLDDARLLLDLSPLAVARCWEAPAFRAAYLSHRLAINPPVESFGLRAHCWGCESLTPACPACAAVAYGLARLAALEPEVQAFAVERVREYLRVLRRWEISPVEDEVDLGELYADVAEDAPADFTAPPVEVEVWADGRRVVFAVSTILNGGHVSPLDWREPNGPRPKRKRKWVPTGRPVGRPRKVKAAGA